MTRTMKIGVVFCLLIVAIAATIYIWQAALGPTLAAAECRAEQAAMRKCVTDANDADAACEPLLRAQQECEQKCADAENCTFDEACAAQMEAYDTCHEPVEDTSLKCVAKVPVMADCPYQP